MVKIDQSGLQGKIRDRPISRELEVVLIKAGDAAGIDRIVVTSGGQPGTKGLSTGSTRHNNGRAADLHLVARGKTLSFSDTDANDTVKKFVIAAAANGATGIGAGVNYMGSETLHVGFGLNASDKSRLVWGAQGRSANAPAWLRAAANEGWNNPPDWAFNASADLPEDLPEDQDSTTEDEEDSIDIPKRFNIEVIRAAQATQRQWGTPASITLAQWAIESAYGQRMPANSNNPFGIKARPGDPSVSSWTTEYVKGKKITVQQPFRVFGRIEEAFLKHGELLGKAKPYEKARRFTNDPDRFADALTGIYATDPQYGTLLKKIMRSNDLYAFNDAATSAGSGNQSDEETNVTILTRGDEGTEVELVQRQLVKLGYKLGKIDGKFGPLTSEALLAFQNQNDLPTSGIVDAMTRQALKSAPPRQLSEERIRAKEEDLIKDGSRTAINARRSRILSWIAAAFGAVGVGNSALTTAAGGTTPAATPISSASLQPFLEKLQALGSTPSASDLSAITIQARTLLQQLNETAASPEVAKVLDQLRTVLPPDALQNPQVTGALNTLTNGTALQPGANRTVLDFLLTAPSGGTAHSLLQLIADIGASMVPGFGGSVAMLALGLIGRYYANRIAQARVEDHQTGGNINALS